jgi:hypothetical protein
MNRIVTILAFLLLWTGIASAQNTNKFASTRTTDTAYTIGSLRVDSTLRFVKYRSADSNKVLGVDAGGLIVLRTKGAGGSTDSLQTVIDRGRNSNKQIRFGSGANTISTTIDSSSITSRTSSTSYSTFNVTGLISLSGSTRYDYNYQGMIGYNLSNGFYNRLYFTSPSGSDKLTVVQNKSGTVALLTDIPDTTRYLLKSDTTSLLVTHSDLNTHSLSSVNLGGNTVGSAMVYGVIDSQNLVTRTFNTYDTIQAGGKHVVNGKTGEVIMEIKNKIPATGVTQSKAVLIGIGTGVTDPLNEGFVAFGTNVGNTIPRVTQSGLLGYSVLSLRSTTTAGTTILPAFQSGNTGNCLTVGLGSYTNATPNNPSTGNYNVFRVGTASETTGLWSPSTGSANIRAFQAAIRSNASGSYSGTIRAFTDDSMIFTGIASATYIGYEANQNIGWGFRQNGASAKNSFVGRTTFGTVTDNGTDAVQVVGDLNLTTAGNKIKIATGSNASVGTGTLVSGTVTINTTDVTASSLIFITATSAPSGHIYVASKVAGTSFTVTSTGGSDGASFNWFIIN